MYNAHLVLQCFISGLRNSHKAKVYIAYKQSRFLLDPTKIINLEFNNRFETECSFDFVHIYDGASYQSPKIGAFSGNQLPDSVFARSGNVSYCSFTEIKNAY